MAPSEGIEPPVSEPESEVLSITPRGHILNYELSIQPIHFSNETKGLPHYTKELPSFQPRNQTLYLTIID